MVYLQSRSEVFGKSSSQISKNSRPQVAPDEASLALKEVKDLVQVIGTNSWGTRNYTLFFFFFYLAFASNEEAVVSKRYHKLSNQGITARHTIKL